MNAWGLMKGNTYRLSSGKIEVLRLTINNSYIFLWRNFHTSRINFFYPAHINNFFRVIGDTFRQYCIMCLAGSEKNLGTGKKGVIFTNWMLKATVRTFGGIMETGRYPARKAVEISQVGDWTSVHPQLLNGRVRFQFINEQFLFGSRQHKGFRFPQSGTGRQPPCIPQPGNRGERRSGKKGHLWMETNYNLNFNLNDVDKVW